jgi:hypothetical protein
MYAARPKPRPPRRDGRNPARNRMNVLFTMSNNPPRNGRQGNARTGPNAAEPKPDSPQDANRRTQIAARPEWWSQTGSNRRPHACKARALPAELWPHRGRASQMVGLGRLELPTSRLSSARSNQLSYKPGTAPARQTSRPAPRAARDRPAQPQGCPRRKRNEDDEVPPKSSEELRCPKRPEGRDPRQDPAAAGPRKGPSLERR